MTAAGADFIRPNGAIADRCDHCDAPIFLRSRQGTISWSHRKGQRPTDGHRAEPRPIEAGR